MSKKIPVAPAPPAPHPALKLWRVQILPCPRKVFEAVTEEAAEALYRQRYQLTRRDLVASIEDVTDELSIKRPAIAARV